MEYNNTEVAPQVSERGVAPRNSGNEQRVSILSWNIAGLSSKVDHTDWDDFIDSYDFCLFQETWAVEPLHRVGHVMYYVPAVQGLRGRPSGGLSIWVSTHLGYNIKRIDIPSRILCVLFNKSLKIAIINVYSRPAKLGQISQTVESLQAFLPTLQKGVHIIVGGDFNCHFEPLSGITPTITSDEDSVWAIRNFSVYPCCKSDHNPLALVLDCPKPVEGGAMIDNPRSNPILVDGGRRIILHASSTKHQYSHYRFYGFLTPFLPSRSDDSSIALR